MPATTTSDRVEPLLNWLRGAAVGALLRFRVDATPSPTSRPRVARFDTYYANPYAEWLQACQRQHAEQKPGEPVEGRLGVVLDVVIERPRTSKLTEPKGDVDNYAKGPLDGATKAGIWGDDGQVVCLAASKRFAAAGEKPGVTIHVGRIAA